MENHGKRGIFQRAVLNCAWRLTNSLFIKIIPLSGLRGWLSPALPCLFLLLALRPISSFMLSTDQSQKHTNMLQNLSWKALLWHPSSLTAISFCSFHSNSWLKSWKHWRFSPLPRVSSLTSASVQSTFLPWRCASGPHDSHPHFHVFTVTGAFAVFIVLDPACHRVGCSLLLETPFCSGLLWHPVFRSSSYPRVSPPSSPSPWWPFFLYLPSKFSLVPGPSILFHLCFLTG